MKMGEERFMMLRKIEALFKAKSPLSKKLAAQINKIV